MPLGLDQAADITELEREVFAAGIRLAGHGGGVIGHQQVFIADFAIGLERLDEIDIAVIGEDFGDEVVAAALDVAEMDIEDFLAAAEVANDVENLFLRI